MNVTSHTTNIIMETFNRYRTKSTDTCTIQILWGSINTVHFLVCLGDEVWIIWSWDPLPICLGRCWCHLCSNTYIRPFPSFFASKIGWWKCLGSIKFKFQFYPHQQESTSYTQFIWSPCTAPSFPLCLCPLFLVTFILGWCTAQYHSTANVII